MKSQQLPYKQAPFSFSTDSKTPIQSIQNLTTKLYCPHGKISSNLCGNQKCQNKRLICLQRDCQCRKEHKICVPISTEGLIQILTNKIISPKQFYDKTLSQIDEIVDKVSELREKISDLLQKQYDFFGLSENQTQFMKLLQTQKLQNLTGIKLMNIYSNLSKELAKTKILAYQKQIEKVLKSFTHKIQKTSKKVLKVTSKMLSIKQCKNSEEIMFQDSLIVRTSNEEQNIKKFFPNLKLQKIKLIYRASEYDFNTVKFFQKIKQIHHSLIIVKTEYGKIIGGYTHKQWDVFQHNTVDSGLGEKSFLFDLTENLKFKYHGRRSQKQITPSSGTLFGPFFGEGPDLVISNKANQNNDSKGSINNSYRCENIYKKLEAGFTGNLNGDNFRVIEWQAWQLHFGSNLLERIRNLSQSSIDTSSNPFQSKLRNRRSRSRDQYGSSPSQQRGYKQYRRLRKNRRSPSRSITISDSPSSSSSSSF